jgi:hypothetical protein
MVAGLALVVGSVLVIAGMAGLVLQARKPWAGSGIPGTAVSARDGPGPGPGTVPPAEGWPGALAVAALLFVVLLVGGWLRIHGIDAKTLTHTEAILPNLAWPPDSWPPSRHSFYDTFWWHYHSELHPPAHYFLDWGWTKVFGTSLASLRLPSALFGLGAILATYRIGALTHYRRVGLLASAFLAFNGFHIYYSQYARVYMMGTFLALLSTLALLHVLRGGAHRGRWEVAYVLASWLAIYTQTFFWAVLAIQMCWVAMHVDRPGRVIERVFRLQAIVVMVGAAALAHQIYHPPPRDFPDPTLAFVVDYLSFGFALLRDTMSIPERGLPTMWYGSLAALSILLVVAGSVRWARGPGRGGTSDDAEKEATVDDASTPDGSDLSRAATGLVAAGAALVTLGFVILALRRQGLMAPTVAVPLLALGLPILARRVRTVLAGRRRAPALRSFALRLSRPTSLVILLACLPTLALVVASFHLSVLNSRAFLMFVPFLLIVAAAGAWRLGRAPLVRVPLLISLVMVHAASVVHWRDYPSEARDYAGLAERMNARMLPGDLLFVVPRAYYVTPLFFYLADRGYTYVTRDFDRAVGTDAAARVWIVYFASDKYGPFTTTTEEMTGALAGFRLEDEVESLRSRAQLFVRETLALRDAGTSVRIRSSSEFVSDHAPSGRGAPIHCGRRLFS